MTKDKQKFVMYAVPCDKAFVIEKQKVEDFIKESNTFEERSFVKNLADELKKII